MLDQIEALLSQFLASSQNPKEEEEFRQESIAAIYSAALEFCATSSEFIRNHYHAVYVFSEQKFLGPSIFYAYLKLHQIPLSNLALKLNTSNAIQFLQFCGDYPIQHKQKPIQIEGFLLSNSANTIQVFDQQTIELVTIQLDTKTSSYNIQKMLKPWRKLRLEEIQWQKNIGTVETAKILIEPECLIDATDIASVITPNGVSALQFLIQKCLPDSGNLKAALGSVINSIADQILKGEEVERSIDKSFEEQKLRLAGYPFDLKLTQQEILESHVNHLKMFAEQISNHQFGTELSYYSPKEGLSGRLDILSQTDEKPTRITELKSGKAPNGAIWKPHLAQLGVYALLVGRNSVKSEILYSQKHHLPIPVEQSGFDYPQIQYARNLIVTLIFELAEGKLQLFDFMEKAKLDDIPQFMHQKLAEFQIAWQHSTLAAKHWYSESIAFLLREYINAKTGMFSDPMRQTNGFASNWKDAEYKRNLKFLGISNLSLFKGQEGWVIEFPKDTKHAFREKDRVILFQGTELGSQNSPVLRVEIDRIEGDLCYLKGDTEIPEWLFDSKLKWSISFDLYENGIWKLVQFNFQFLQAGQAYQEAFFQAKVPSPIQKYRCDNNRLTDFQKKTVNEALAAQTIYCMQGPPGTGKSSSFILAYIQTLIEQGSERILLTAFTNKAVSELEEKLRSAQISFIKLGRGNHEYSLQSLLKDTPIHKVKEKIQGVRVFLSTISTLQSQFQYLARLTSFDQLIIDEAGQLTEPFIAGIASYTNKLVLVGDQNQLPAVVTQAEAYTKVKSSTLSAFGYQNWTDSALERWFELLPNTNKSTFKEHFRMHEEIAQCIQFAYGNQLVAPIPKQKFSLLEEFNRPLKWQSRILFFPTQTTEMGKTSQEEVERISELLVNKKEWTNPEYSVGIISPWKAQLASISSHLYQLGLKDENLAIDTVERFQGSENNVILFSCAVQNEFMLQSMSSMNRAGIDRKLLVAVSRAKSQFILLGNPKFLQLHSQLKSILDIALWID